MNCSSSTVTSVQPGLFPSSGADSLELTARGNFPITDWFKQIYGRLSRILIG